jgi:von Willebrand factor type A domain
VNLSFLTPTASLVGLATLLALAMLVAGEIRARRACAVLGLRPRQVRLMLTDAGALVGIGALVALAAAQPVVSSVREGRGRTDAEVIAVIDITRSMLARPGPTEPTRLDRARSLAKQLRAGVPEVRVGVASITDRVLPHLFPTLTASAFSATLDRAIGIERPPPDRRARRRATALGALPDVARLNFFSAGVRRRVAVVFTDGETIPVGLGTLRARFIQGSTTLVFVHVWGPDERVYLRGGSTERYRPDPASRLTLEQVATAVDGAVFDERQLEEATAAIRRTLGSGPLARQGRELRAVELGPAVLAFAFAPLLFVLRRRNF